MLKYNLPDEVVTLLRKNINQFKYYEEVHAQKGTIDGYQKASVNCKIRLENEAILAKYIVN
jgi:hypothetical protein